MMVSQRIATKTKLHTAVDHDNSSMITFFLLAPLILHLCERVSYGLGFYNAVLLDLLEALVYGVAAVWVMHYTIRHKFVAIPIALLLVYLFIYCVSWLLVPETRSLLYSEFVYCAFRMIWAFCVVYCIVDARALCLSLYRRSWIAVAFLGAVMLFPDMPGSTYLNISSDLLIPTIVVFCAALFCKKKLGWLLFVVFFSVVFLMGARRFAVQILITVFVLLLLMAKLKDKRSMSILFLGALLLFFLLVALWPTIVAQLLVLFPDSRSVLLLVEGDYLDYGLRGYLYDYLLNIVVQDPLTVRGAYSDNVAWGQVAPFYYSLVNPGAQLVIESYSGTGAHNLFVQLLFEYGIVIGGGLLVVFLVVIVRAFVYIFSCNDVDSWIVAALFLIPLVVLLYAGGSYLGNDEFMYALAALVFLYRKKQKR